MHDLCMNFPGPPLFSVSKKDGAHYATTGPYTLRSVPKSCSYFLPYWDFGAPFPDQGRIGSLFEVSIKITTQCS